MSTAPKKTIRKTPSAAKRPAAKKPAAKKPAAKRVAKEVQRVEIFEKEPDGTRLIRAINQRMAVLGMTAADVAFKLDMSYSYFITLANKPSRFAGIDRRFMRNIARFLGINTIMAYQYAGFFEDEDVNVDVSVDTLLADSRELMEKDRVYGFYAPDVELWDKLPLQLRMFIYFLYHDVALLRPKALQLEQILEQKKRSGKTRRSA